MKGEKKNYNTLRFPGRRLGTDFTLINKLGDYTVYVLFNCRGGVVRSRELKILYVYGQLYSCFIIEILFYILSTERGKELMTLTIFRVFDSLRSSLRIVIFVRRGLSLFTCLIQHASKPHRKQWPTQSCDHAPSEDATHIFNILSVAKYYK